MITNSNYSTRFESSSARTRLAGALLAGFFVASPPARADYPIASHRYLADPAQLVHDGRIYLYCSNDDDNTTNAAYLMASIVAVSTSDLKNWTDHGEVLRVPRDASWAMYSWAPALAARNGRIYMYFGNNANGVGVVSSTSPTGPFTDPKGGYLVNASTPGASGTSGGWLFDPGIFVDDDGQAYLYFGGNGDTNARVIRLNSDMISVSGSAIALTVPNFFEASWMHKRNGTYYFSYSTTPAADLRIDYMTSSSPTSGFTHRGTVGPPPPSNNNNNHAAIFEFNGVWYHAYHNRYVANQAGDPPGYKRNIAMERLTYAADGAMQPVTYTMDGLTQLANLNPYARVEAETFNAQSGIETEKCSEGGMNVTSIGNGDWVRVRGVDFGAMGATSFSARVASTAAGGSIELRLASATGTLLGTCPVPATGGAQTWMTTSCDVTGATGVKDLYLKFTGSGSNLFGVNHWQFTGPGGGGGGAGGGGSGGAPGGAGGMGGGGASGGVGGAMNGGVPNGGTSGAGATPGDAGQGTGGAQGGNSGTPGTSGSGDGGTSSGGTSTTGGAGPAGGGASGGAAAGNSTTPDNDESSGCGCRTTGRASSAGWLATLSLLALAFRRVRRVTPRASDRGV